MNKTQFKEEFKKTLNTMYSIMEKKNADYAKESAFWNFELVEKLWITSIEKGILVRMADKMSRISTIIDQEAQVKDEAIEDTLQDLANYAIILKIYLEYRSKLVIWVDQWAVNWDYSSIAIFKQYPDKIYKPIEEAFNFFRYDRAELDFKYDLKRFKTLEEFQVYIINKYKDDRSN